MRTLAIALFLAASVTAQTPRPMTPDDVLAVQAVNGVKISPDGKMVLYELAYSDLKENQPHNEIWLAPATGAPGAFKPRKFTSGREDRSPQWSPDGQWVAFLGTRGTAAASGEPPRPQVYLMPAFGGEAEALTDAKGGVTAFAWSPDSTRVAFVATVPLTEAQEKDQKDKNDARVVDGDYRFSHLWVIGTASRKSTEIVKNDAVLADPQWSPDGTRLAYVSRPGGSPFYERPDVASFGQFAVRPSHQRVGIGRTLMTLVEKRAAEKGVAELAMDTSEHAAHLIAFYQALGYRFVEYCQWDVTNYRSMVFAKRLT